MGNLINCTDCGHEVSEKAKSCPNCGAPIKKKSPDRAIGILAVIGIVIFFIYSVSSIPTTESPSSESGSTSASTTPTVTTRSDGRITYYATKNAKVRRGPGDEHDYMGILTKGKSRRCLPKSDESDWIKCGEESYIHSSFLTASAESPGTSTSQLILKVESLYNNIYVTRQDNYLSMAFGHNRKFYTESVINLADLTELPVIYTRFMTASIAYVENPEDILMIGSGGGRISSYLHHHIRNAHVVVVELDPEVQKIAKEYFHIPEDERYEVNVQDGRLFLLKDPQKYDVILIDAYRGPFVPFHLLTKEFYELVSAHLKDGGVVAQNVAPSTMLFDSAFVTIKSVFPRVDIYPAGSNAILIANRSSSYDYAQLERLASAADAEYGFRYPLKEMIQMRKIFAPAVSATVLIDDFAPVNALRSIEKHNRRWQ